MNTQGVFLGLGSNLGNRLENINKAIALLRMIDGVAIEKISSIIETEPVDAPGPDYFNAVVKIKTVLEPEELLEHLQEIESSLGRIRSFRNAPRTIDLDILFYDNKIIDRPGIRVPHPRMFERDFVIKPLLEIEPEMAELLQKPEKIFKENKEGL
ncbi:MAG: 2-amino-4-hydroxy-6-hydroxymethyldihydropteridine diphosphokinase [Candidatus Omnitrophica bacterium]|nr:2-amino-4-hydroxy-6-hydroxymethyldihydropteridine diphosphokinase [Candidatus Omnitrophota bacterium]MDD5430341.1 2-amino-4-hydroxy-6-hydroxymethyldihydropteridine diphosphokinase [Candidatus Omnitrophota bacterium]